MRFQQKFPRLTFHGGAHPQIGYASVFFAGHPGDIYGREMEVEPVRFLRPEIKFPSLEELKSQLARDAAHAAEALEEGE